MFSVRIVTADHYMCQPLPDLDVIYSDFRGTEVKQVPVIRIFGSTPTGEKVCLHVHGVFPYIYVPYDGLEQKEGEAYRLASSLDKAINVSLGKSNAVTQHVYKISLVSGRPFYGYHSKEHQFFKIFFYNPIMVKRAADLLQSGAVLSKMFQPHEAHLTFILQFFIDFNLYGMNFIDLSEVKFRRPLTNREIKTKSSENVSQENIGMMNFGPVPEDLFLPESVLRVSFCELECDTLATAITNRSTVSEKMTVIPGLASIWEEEKERRRLHGMSSQLSTALSQMRKSSPFTKTELHYLQKMNDQFFVHKQADSPSVSVNSGNESVLDNSGYPSETPENAILQSASLVEVQLPTPYKNTIRKTEEVSNLQTSPEEDHLLSTQNSIKFDSQDKSLMNAWEGMLDDQDQDSVLGSQMPFKVTSRVDKIDEDRPQEDVEDNLLLEMSQVFDWEEGMETKGNSAYITGSCADSEETADIKGESKELKVTEMQECSKDEGNEKEKELETKEVDEVCCISEREDYFWNDEDEDDFEVSPIAQLDGADDLITPKKKKNAEMSLLRNKKTLGVRRQLPILLKKENPLDSKSLSSPSVGMNESDVAKNIDQPSGSAQKLTTVPGRQSIHGIEKLNHQIVAKHKRIYELKKLNKPIISSSEKSKGDKKKFSPIHLSLKRTTSIRRQSEEFESQKSSSVSVIEKKIHTTKPCSVRLELIDEFHLKYLCDKHKLKISNSSLKLLRGVSLDEQFLHLSCHENSELIISTQNTSSENSYQQLGMDNSHESDVNTICQSVDLHLPSSSSVDHKDTLSKSNSFGNLSFSSYTNKKSKKIEKTDHAKVMMLDNSFLELDCSIPEKTLSPPRNMNMEKAEKRVCSPKKSKEGKEKGGGDRSYYKPLEIVFQRSPTHLRNKKIDEKVLQESPVHQHELQNSFDLGHVKEVENETPHELTSNVNKSVEADNCKLRVEGEISDMERKLDCPMSSEAIHDAVEGHQNEEEQSAVKRRLKFPDPVNDSQISETSGTRTMSPLSDSHFSWDENDMKKHSESSENDEELGILSFCEEDVFNSTVLTPSFLVKPAKLEIMATQSPLAKEKDEKGQPATKEGKFESEIADLKDMEIDSPNHSILTFSSDEDSVEIQDTKDLFDLNFEAVDDNGLEYAPLLRAPSRKEVENFRYDQEPAGQLFCSDPDDIPSKPMEVCEVVLKLISNRPNCLVPFENCLEIEGLEGHRKRILGTLFGEAEELEIGNQWEKISKIALLPDAGFKEVIITPLQNPPKYEEVSRWMADEGFHKEKKKLDDEFSVTKKLVVRGPMEGHSDDEDLEVISLSPCSTSSSQEITNRGSYILQSTPHSSVKHIQKHFQTPAQSDLEFSPIQAESDEDDIIMSTPPPVLEDGSSKKKGSKIKSSKLSWSRERLLRGTKSRKNILRTIKEDNSNSSSSNSMNDELTSGESLGKAQKKLNILRKHQPKLQNSFLVKQNHLIGLGGSGHSSCQIDGVSPNNTYGFQNSPSNLQNAKAIQKAEHVTVMTMEVHVRTRGDFRPDPEYDPIQAIFYCVMDDYNSESDKNKEIGMILIDDSSEPVSQLMKKCGMTIKSVQTVSDEISLFKNLSDLLRKWDPDIVAGYEVEMLSWGYVLERGTHLGLDVKSLISRVPATTSVEAVSKDKPNDLFDLDSKRLKDFEDYDPINLPGRIVLNVWRIMRSEAALTSYTFENVMYHLLHERVSLHSFRHLNNWWDHRTHLYRWITAQHWFTRVEGVMRLLFQLDIIGRTSELARLFGIQFYEVFSRGSQFRVESIMLRFAKPLNYVCVSPNSKQRASMRAPEQLPLIMEPESRFFADPVIVLDFQSLYPSIIIAYNYCFSTCLGRVKHLGQISPFEFGCTTLMVPPDTIAKLLMKQKKICSNDEENSRSMISFSPCGVAFVGRGVREGILPRMLSQILETRLMVKKALKENKGNRVVERVLNNRQLGLKLIANVTYGYTSANFSGRMPCIEVGDSVVSKGRETLERAIELVHKKWGSQGVRVVYGDTDSLFVLAKGFSRPEAFKLGAEIADLVTENNPSPVKLKLEKIFQPCLLQTKKRYVGYAYESPDQEKPVFDAKGIETVRRDGCPAVAKVLEKALRLLFDTRDVSLVKLHVQRQLGKLLSGRLSLQELTFAREYRGAAGYRPGACVPALQLARRWVSSDRRAEPRSGERVPYVIISGPPGLPLFQLVRSPLELLMINKQDGPSGSSGQQPARVNAHYYVTKVLIPPLQRCFSLIGVDVESWYADMPRKFRSLIQPRGTGSTLDINLGKQVKGMDNCAGTSKKSTISAYFASSDCVACGAPLDPGNQAALCQLCQKNAHNTAFILSSRCNSWERSAASLTKICQSCCKRMESIECISLDCPVLYRRDQALLELEQVAAVRNVLSKLSW